MKIRFNDHRGDLRKGYFFQIEIPYDTELSVRMAPDSSEWIVNDSVTNVYESEAYAELWFESQERRDCPLHASHITSYEGRAISSAELNGNDQLAEFVRSCIEPSVIVTEGFGRRLLGSHLRGVALKYLPISLNQSSLQQIPRLYELDFQGHNCVRPMRYRAPEPNECPRCHFGPIVCPGCNYIEFVCLQCGLELVGVDNASHECPFSVEITADTDYIVEAHEWDGSDFFQRMYITRTTLRYLTSLNAKPFIAKPCWANVERLTKSQLAALDAM